MKYSSWPSACGVAVRQEASPHAAPAVGFGAPPGSHEWEPDFDKYHADLRSELQKKLDAAPKPEPAPAPSTVRKAS